MAIPVAPAAPTAPNAPTAPRPVPAAPRWAVLAAHAVTLTTLPAALWRIGVACGLPLGYTEAGFRRIRGDGWEGPAWLVLLSVLTEAAALLTLVLVRDWRLFSPRVTTAIAGTGAVVLAALWTPFLFWWAVPNAAMTETGHLLVGFVYLPLVAWAPLLAAVTVNYHRRHRR
ncbi:hypothetical protein ACFQU9_34900 [Actinomadura namibiensis]|uniref:Uncharacterized protein n=1 Tax=Actinomadura namibiensis TaxID=182080 RepID=A0A7W3QRF1_ACTNM|nr:hypothetical protein [Actinomadura namibiensis]MBA8956669.1 hypothetical protein [Actinomadura namibiensis]